MDGGQKATCVPKKIAPVKRASAILQTIADIEEQVRAASGHLASVWGILGTLQDEDTHARNIRHHMTNILFREHSTSDEGQENKEPPKDCGIALQLSEMRLALSDKKLRNKADTAQKKLGYIRDIVQRAAEDTNPKGFAGIRQLIAESALSDDQKASALAEFELYKGGCEKIGAIATGYLATKAAYRS
jgi:leucyl aminopeptidase